MMRIQKIIEIFSNKEKLKSKDLHIQENNGNRNVSHLVPSDSTFISRSTCYLYLRCNPRDISSHLFLYNFYLSL